MNTDKPFEDMTDEEKRKLAARLLGSVKSPGKGVRSAENGRKFAGHTEETKARLREAQKARREREKAESDKPLTTHTAEAKERIRAAQVARWAKYRAEKEAKANE